MAEVTVSQFAEVLKVPVDRLLHAARPGRHQVPGADDIISDEAKMELLTHLRRAHGRGEDAAAPRKITLKRKAQQEIKVASTQGRARTVNVEVRVKRTYLNRTVLEEEQRQRQEEIDRVRQAEEDQRMEAERARERAARGRASRARADRGRGAPPRRRRGAGARRGRGSPRQPSSANASATERERADGEAPRGGAGQAGRAAARRARVVEPAVRRARARPHQVRPPGTACRRGCQRPLQEEADAEPQPAPRAGGSRRAAACSRCLRRP